MLVMDGSLCLFHTDVASFASLPLLMKALTLFLRMPLCLSCDLYSPVCLTFRLCLSVEWTRLMAAVMVDMDPVLLRTTFRTTEWVPPQCWAIRLVISQENRIDGELKSWIIPVLFGFNVQMLVTSAQKRNKTPHALIIWFKKSKTL